MLLLQNIYIVYSQTKINKYVLYINYLHKQYLNIKYIKNSEVSRRMLSKSHLYHASLKKILEGTYNFYRLLEIFLQRSHFTPKIQN